MTDLTHDYENRRARCQESQYRDALEVFAGNRPLTVVEKRKAPATYAWLNCRPAREGDRAKVSFRDGAEGWEMVVAAPGFFEAYEDLLASRGLYKSRYSFQIAMGTLMGIIQGDPESPEVWRETVYWWANVADYCSCSKCGGPLSSNEMMAQAHKLRRTQYHA